MTKLIRPKARPSEIVRPDPEDLLYLGKPYANWYAENGKKRRFFLLNVGQVVTRLQLTPTSPGTDEYFEQAGKIIERQTEWHLHYGARIKLSRTHLYENRGDGRDAAKKFGQALTIIVALEVAARRLKRPDINVYDYLRIIPAYYFVDRFNAQRLAEISTHHGKLTDADRAKMFGAANKDKGFAELCLDAMGQGGRTSLLGELANGHCATAFVCKALQDFVSQHYPPQLHVGPVRTVGDEQGQGILGTRKAAPSLKVPRTRDRSDLQGGS